MVNVIISFKSGLNTSGGNLQVYIEHLLKGVLLTNAIPSTLQGEG